MQQHAGSTESAPEGAGTTGEETQPQEWVRNGRGRETSYRKLDPPYLQVVYRSVGEAHWTAAVHPSNISHIWPWATPLFISSDNPTSTKAKEQADQWTARRQNARDWLRDWANSARFPEAASAPEFPEELREVILDLLA